MYKILNNETSNYLTAKFVNRSDYTPSYTLRETEGKLALPPPRTDHYKRSFSFSGTALWNSLPSNIKQKISLNNFKPKLGCHCFMFLSRRHCKAGEVDFYFELVNVEFCNRDRIWLA